MKGFELILMKCGGSVFIFICIFTCPIILVLFIVKCFCSFSFTHLPYQWHLCMGPLLCSFPNLFLSSCLYLLLPVIHCSVWCSLNHIIKMDLFSPVTVIYSIVSLFRIHCFVCKSKEIIAISSYKFLGILLQFCWIRVQTEKNENLSMMLSYLHIYIYWCSYLSLFYGILQFLL